MGFPTLKEREKFAKLLKDFSWTDDLFAELDGKEPKEAMELLAKHVRKQFRKRDRLGVFPDDASLTEKYAGSDPTGTYCELDLSLQSRLDKVRMMSQFRPEAARKYAERAMRDVKALQEAAAEKYAQLRLYERMAKMAPTQAIYNAIREEYEALGKDPDIQKHREAIEVIEYVMGLTDKKPAALDRVREAKSSPAENEGYLYIPQSVLSARKRPHALPQSTKISFADIARHKAMESLCGVAVWNDPPDSLPSDLELSGSEHNERLIKWQLRDTADKLLEPLFSGVEERFRTYTSGEIGVINRGDLIIVNGKTVREHMQAHYKKLGLEEDAEKRAQFKRDYPTFDAYYQKWVRQASADLVGSALSSDLRVEVFVPSPDGTIPEIPMRMERAGHPQSELQPAALGEAKQFFNKFGFYKEEAAAASDAQREYEMHMQARERAREQYQRQCFYLEELRRIDERVKRECRAIIDTAEKTMEGVIELGRVIVQLMGIESGRETVDAFLGENAASLDELEARKGGLKITNARSTVASVAVFLMLGRERDTSTLPLSAVMDPSELTERKKVCGSEAAALLTQDPFDPHKLAEGLTRGMSIFDGHIAEMVQDLDITKEEKLFSKEAAPLWAAIRAGRDIARFCRENPDFLSGPMLEAAEDFFGDGADPEKIARYWLNEKLESIEKLGEYLDCARESMKAKEELSRSADRLTVQQTTEKLAKISRFETLRRLYVRHCDIDRCPYERVRQEELSCLGEEVFRSNAQLRRLAEYMAHDKTVCDAIKTAAASGQFQRSLSLDVRKDGVTLYSALIPQEPVIEHGPSAQTPQQPQRTLEWESPSMHR
ncbi:MAG: hypothetical protein IJA73_00560 [Oscillospiraceae bacterium]|nr:hypothetical protein [Oscillospiraceae bacterium]